MGVGVGGGGGGGGEGGTEPQFSSNKSIVIPIQ